MKIKVDLHYAVQRDRLTRKIVYLECCFCRWRIHRGYLVRFMGRATDRALYGEMKTRMFAHVGHKHLEARAS